MEEISEISVFDVNISTAQQYLFQVSDCLAQYSWTYKIRNTEILISSVLDKIPINWCEALSHLPIADLQALVHNPKKVNLPPSLTDFVELCYKLGKFRFPSKHLQSEDDGNHTYIPFKVSLKKQLEIKAISALIGKVCQDLECHTILDVGSGLGYLDQILHHQYGLTCIGLDHSEKYTVTAIERIKDDPCCGSMQFNTLEVSNSQNCCEEIKTILNENTLKTCPCHSKSFGSRNGGGRAAAMVGLHSCGNLAQDMMRLFCRLDDIRALVCVGCCYNKINLSDFPMSKAGQSAVLNTHKNFPDWAPCTSGLRLASHGTPSNAISTIINDFGHKSLFYRAVLEYYIRKENISWKQPKRHIRPSDVADFETYCKHMLCNSDSERALNKLLNLYNEKKYLFPRVKCLLILQMLLQPLWEGFVTLDRILFFREQSVPVRAVALWDDEKSSRNLALYAFKK